MATDTWDRSIPYLFATHVAERPLAAAVWADGTEMTYAELDRRADEVAGWLAANGVGPEGIVALRIDRGHDLIAALLGILKAGGAYLALEAHVPPTRRERMIRAAGAVALVTTDPDMRADVPTLRLSPGVPIDGSGPYAAPDVHPDGLAYVSFTSGSTGRPKAVGVPHRAVARLVEGGFAETGPNETFLHLSPVAFDASTFEIWCCLLTGGRLVVHPPGPLSGDELASLLSEQQVTVAWLTAGLFHQMVEHHLDALSSLSQLLAGGDVLNPVHVNAFVRRHPDIRLVNGYGPTENTTFTTCHEITGPIAGSVPIGVPITGTSVRVLDAALVTVPAGERGELYAAGAGLSRGYLNEPAATALAFLPDPYADQPGQRIYRTGDSVRETDSGALEFIGRGDRQVKIRGYRVELTEVEREMAVLPGARQVIVIVQRDRIGENCLIAYFVPDPAVDVEPEHLITSFRRRLRAVLPGPMIPAAFVAVHEFPLTANGKVDTVKLPVPPRHGRQADSDYVAPRTTTEQMLCDLWAETLAIDLVGVDDEFFDLGGHSLLAMDLIGRIEGVFGVEMPIRQMLRHPTIAECAQVIDDALVTAGAAG